MDFPSADQWRRQKIILRWA